MAQQDRISKINSLILEELTKILSKIGAEDQELLITITKVDTTRDLRAARVYFTVLPENKKGSAIEYLNKVKNKCQKILGEKIKIKYIPRITFNIDKGYQNAQTVEKILNQIHKKDV